ncbi:hypothetical protein BLNAU_6433 [Blattamonas nauphoetae]|uniref:Uncharacterized protein n=1 Tax=Blattamonas nauphoetae TaxID=2049346 RepID=A0ABQ9Y4M6_9EUKA|nr:hypothetical protein BLNAU_6433 [Blattamonas nauphoetae]
MPQIQNRNFRTELYQLLVKHRPLPLTDVCQHHHNRERNVSLLITKHSCARSHQQKHHRASVSVDVVPLQTFCPSMNSSSSLFLRHSAPTFLQLSLSFILILPFSNNKAHLRHLNPTQERTSTSGSRLTCTNPQQQRHRSWKAWMSELKSRRQPTSSSCRAAPHVADKLSTVYVQTSLRLSTKDHPSPLHCQVTYSTLASPVPSPSFCPANGEDESVQETEVD